jgi:sulfite exporter TauE/SafE
MHCNACTLLIESELANYPEVTHAKAFLSSKTVEIIGDFGTMPAAEIAEHLTTTIADNGYTLSLEKEQFNTKNWSDFKIAIPVAIGFAILFVLLQKIGLLNMVGGGTVTLGTAFIIGIIASLSTCMAVVGGLVLSLSATFAKEGDRVKPQLLFHTGRLVSFFVLGGVIGALGSAFTLNTTGTFALSLIIGLVMLILGLNLLDVFHWTKKLQPTMPKFIASKAHGVSKLNHTLTPLLVGVATFFLPCGFTQSMQLYTLSTGNFMDGAFTMFAFALGTLPVLALLSFSSFSIQNSAKSGIFFKSAGLIVILFALFNIINSLVVIGILPPLFNF